MIGFLVLLASLLAFWIGLFVYLPIWLFIPVFFMLTCGSSK